MDLKGDWSSSATYNIGDVVRYTDGVMYHLQHPAPSGTPPVDTLYWGRLADPVAQAVEMGLDYVEAAVPKLANNLTTTTGGKALDARQGKALKTLIDDVQTGLTELSTGLTELSPDAKTLVLTSSTAESTKKFAITVDDSGELTATEIIGGDS